MSDLSTSEKIVGLFATFRENETEIERMEAQVREKTVAQEKDQRELDFVGKTVAQKMQTPWNPCMQLRKKLSL